jgi:acetylornithine deacetylase
LLARLVAFDTTSRNPNLPLIESVGAYLAALGVPYRLSRDGTGSKANLHAIVGPQAPGGVAFSGHVDTVPVDGQAWTGDPFALRRRDGRLVGRGTADMKGFVAAMLAAVPDLLAANLARPVHLFLSYDEEVSCDGARRLVDDLGESGLLPALCIVGEPTGMQPVLAHKGRLAAEALVRGKAWHSSETDRGANAVQAAAEAVAWIAAEARRRERDGPFKPGFDPPCTTWHVGTFEGGTILNIVPERARFVFEIRNLPGEDSRADLARFEAHVRAEIEPRLRAVDPACGFEVRVLNVLPSFSLDPAHALADAVRQVTGANATGKVSYGTEAGIYQEAGLATIVCGPGHIAQAHTADEWIAEDQLAQCDLFLRRIAARLAA